MNPILGRIVGWAVPVASIALAAYLIVDARQEFIAAEAARDKYSTELQQAIIDLDATNLTQQKTTVYAGVPLKVGEETFFLNDLRQRASQAGVTILKWRQASQSAAAGAPGSPPPTPTSPPENADATQQAATADAELLADVTRVSSTLEIEGAFNDVRAFVSRFALSPRLYTLSDITWRRNPEDSSTRLTLTISRYLYGTPPPNPANPAPTISR